MTNEKETYCRLTEENSWEGETWCHYFLAEPGVFQVLEALLDRLSDHDFTDLKIVELSDEEATILANIDEGYMQPHWFGKLDVSKLSSVSSQEDLYKGQIRDCAEDLFVVVDTTEASEVVVDFSE
jgi:hypothetical protein